MPAPRRTTALVLLVAAQAAWANDPALYDLSSRSLAIPPEIIALPLSSPPIDGFIPRMVVALTNQMDRNDSTFSSQAYTLPANSTYWYPAGNYLPAPTAGNPTPAYFIATFDTGAVSHILSASTAALVDLDNANRGGGYSAELLGASGREEALISDPVGFYMTSFASASSDGASISVAPGSLKGHWNTSILTAKEDSVLPNIIGSPILASYQVAISNTNTRRLTVGGETHRTPDVSFNDLNTPLPSGYVRLTLTVQSPMGVSPSASFFPSIDNFDYWGDNPTISTFWGSLFARASATHTAGSITNEEFLFDTGAQVTVLSQDSAASVGFYSAGPNPSTPDFYVEVLGVGGVMQVPGFYLQSLSVTTNGGPMTWTNVPVIVYDLPDSRDGVGFIPGILGTNLFTDRDLIINGGTSNPFVGISPVINARWRSAEPSSNWGNDDNWILGVPDAPGAPANFTTAAISPQTITLDADYTAGSLTFDSPHSHSLDGTGTLTLAGSADTPPSIRVLSGSHAISAPLEFAAPGTLLISPGAALDIAGNTLTLATSAATLREYLLAGQLTSSTADPDGILSLGYFDTGTSLLVKLALTGDADLDGVITSVDFFRLDAGYLMGGTFWFDGDFNYDGVITAADYFLIDSTYAKLQGGQLSAAFLNQREAQFGPAYTAQLASSVPEPASALLTAAAGLLLVRRRVSPAPRPQDRSRR